MFNQVSKYVLLSNWLNHFFVIINKNVFFVHSQLLPRPEYSFDVEPLPIATSSSSKKFSHKLCSKYFCYWSTKPNILLVLIFSAKKKKMIAGMIVTLILAVSLVSMTIIFAPQTIEVPLPTRNITFPKSNYLLSTIFCITKSV